MPLKRVALLLLPLVLSTPSAAQTVNVITGDTMEFGGIIMRLDGIISPRLDDVCLVDGVEVPIGAYAAAELRSIIGNQVPVCHLLDSPHRRGEHFVVACQVYQSRMKDGVWITEFRDLARVLVEKGAAWDYPPESFMTYAPAEDLAMSRRSSAPSQRWETYKPLRDRKALRVRPEPPVRI